VGVYIVTFLVQVVGLGQNGIPDRVRGISDFDPEGILTKETPVHDDTHGPVVGLIGERDPHPTVRAAVNACCPGGEGDIRPEGNSVRYPILGRELVEIPGQTKVG